MQRCASWRHWELLTPRALGCWIRTENVGHVEVEIGDTVVMLFDAKPGWPPTPAYLRVYVGDVVAAVAQAVAAGARTVTHPTSVSSASASPVFATPRGTCGGWTSESRTSRPEELASRFADPAAQEAIAYVERTLRDELDAAGTDQQ